MSGQVTMVFTADQAKFVQGVMKAQDSLNKLDQTAAKTAKTSQTGAETAVAGLARWALGAMSVQQAYSLIRAEIEQTAKAGEELTRKLQGSTARSGDIAQMGAVGQQLRGMRGVEHLGMGGRIAAFEGVRGSLPTADLAKKMALSQYAARSTIITGGGAEDAQQFGGVLGEVSKLGYSDSEAASVSLMLQQFAGKYGESVDKQGIKGIQTLMAGGMNREDAMAMFAAAVESGQGAKGFADAKGAKGRRLRDLAKAGGYAEKFRGAASGNYFERQIGAALGSEDIRANLEMQQAAAFGENVDYDQRIAAQAQIAQERGLRASADQAGYGELAQEGVVLMSKAASVGRAITGSKSGEPGVMSEEVAKALYSIEANTRAAAVRPGAQRSMSR